MEEIDNTTVEKEMNANLFDVSNDNVDDDYKKQTEDQPLSDEYDTITKTIQNSFVGYKDYNTKMKNYYKDRQLEGKPDIIDETILNPENDDW